MTASVVEGLDARLIYDGESITVRWRGGGCLELPSEWCAAADVRETEPIQLILRFAAGPQRSLQSGDMLTLRILLQREQALHAREMAHWLTVRAQARTVPDTEHWISFQPSSETEELIDDLHGKLLCPEHCG
ncbi:hypothetical protein [Streptosporangium sp. KLBMP 9127]|nr:hypothetical protein [Streptosporangium sp. KLBMP 9127]